MDPLKANQDYKNNVEIHLIQLGAQKVLLKELISECVCFHTDKILNKKLKEIEQEISFFVSKL